jgi:hypothetical protein
LAPQTAELNTLTLTEQNYVATLPLFSILNIIRRVCGLFPPTIEHVCDNKSAIMATWKENTLSIFDKTKPDADVIMVARSAISKLQQFSTVKAFWVSSHADKQAALYSKQEELNITTDTLAERAHTELPDELKPRHDALQFPEKHISVVISQNKVTSRLPLHITNMIYGPALCTCTSQKEGWMDGPPLLMNPSNGNNSQPHLINLLQHNRPQ